MGLFKKKKKEVVNSNETLNTSNTVKSSDEIFIKSTDEINKSDGVVTIATIDNNNVVPNNALMPQSIDINERREKVLLAKKAKLKKSNGNKFVMSKATTVTSIIVLFVIAALIGFYYHEKNKEKEVDFRLNKVTIELGSQVSSSVKDYVNRANIDEMQYTLDISKVDSKKVGIYKYYVTHEGVKKEGTIEVKDTTAPVVEVKELSIKVNQEFKPSDFITSCTDYSECNVVFENEQIYNSNKQAGEYTVYLVISDKYNNVVRKKTMLKVYDKYEELECILNKDYLNDFGYLMTEVFNISYIDGKYNSYDYYSMYTFKDINKYRERKNKLKDNNLVTFDDKKMVITMKKEYKIQDNLTIKDYQEEFSKKGFSCKLK